MTDESHQSEAKPAGDANGSRGSQELAAKPGEAVLKGFEGLDKAMVWAAGFLIVIIGLIIYSSAFTIPFHAPDRTLLVENEALHSVARWPEAVGEDRRAPLALFTLAMNWAVTPGNPAAFHVVNVILHLINGVLVYLLCRRVLDEKVPEAVKMLSGIIFVVHPVNVEAVASMAGRAQLLGTLFALISVLLYLRATRDPKETGYAYLGLGLLAYAGAFGSLESAWCVPILLVFAQTPGNLSRWSANRLIPVLSYFGVLGFLLAATLAGGADADLASYTETGEFIARLTNAGQGALRAVWPVALSVAPSSWGTVAPALAAFAVLVVLALWGAVLVIRSRSALGMAFFWFPVALLGGALVVPAQVALSNTMLYLPLAGLVWVVPWAFSKLPVRPGFRTGGGLVCAGLILLLAAGSYGRLALWQSETELWRDAVRKAPGETGPKEQLGVAYIQQALQQLAHVTFLHESGYDGEASELEAEAKENLEAGAEMLAKLPEEALSAESLYFLGFAHRRLRNSDAALDSLLASLRKDVSNQACAVEIAQVLQAKASEDDNRYNLLRALDYYEYARGLGGLSGDILASYATALAETGNFEEAAQILSAAVKKTEDGAMRFGDELKAIQTGARQIRGLENKAQELQTAATDSDQSRLLIAQSLVIRKRPLQASYILENILARNSSSVGAWVMLGFVRARMGQAETFLSEWLTPPGANERQGTLWVRLAQMCASQNEWDAAETYLLSPSAGMTGVRMPLLSLGVLALQLRQVKRAHEYLQQATESYPDEFAPWLALCDLAMAQGNAAAARQYLAEAQERKAPEDEVSKRQERLGGAAPKLPEQPGEVIIR